MNAYAKRTAIFAPLLAMVAMFWTTGPLFGLNPSTGDSEELTKLLADSKTEAALLYHDADEMKGFTASKLTWESHSRKLFEIKEHINKCGELVQKLNGLKEQGSPWQQQAIERVTPLLSELATNTTKTIDHLNDGREKIHFPPYTDYLATNADLAGSLSELVADYVSYGKTKDKFEKLSGKLEVSKP